MDTDRIIVAGHSRLGKTALLTAAFDERVKFTISNNAGCSGDALSRGKAGEHIKDICDRFPYWFCRRYASYAEREEELPLDQHFLLALIAPRCVSIGAAAEDIWSDPISQYLACATLSEVYALYGERALVHPDRLPRVGERFHDGQVGFHLRAGKHFFSREDWMYHLSFIKKRYLE